MVPTLGASRGGAVASMSANVRHAARVTRRSAVMTGCLGALLRVPGSWGACSSMVPLRLPRGVRHVPSICYAGPSGCRMAPSRAVRATRRHRLARTARTRRHRVAQRPAYAQLLGGVVPLGATGWHAHRALGVTEWRGRARGPGARSTPRRCRDDGKHAGAWGAPEGSSATLDGVAGGVRSDNRGHCWPIRGK